MASYPRSGNTMLRAYLDKILGLCSGSDMDETLGLNKRLMDSGLAGEGLVDERVLVVKTHYPERSGITMHYADRAILLVRNPLDCITSLFHMVATGSHKLSISDDDWDRLSNLYSEFMQIDLSIWRDFHEFWLKAKVPRYIVRYEDLVERPENTLQGLLEFLLNVPSIEGTRVQKYLKLAVSEASPQIYKPR